MAEGFLILISFFTRIPVGRKIVYNDDDFKKSLYLYALIGAIIGIILSIISLIGNIFDVNFIKGLLLTISYIIITGGIHLDGASDTADGLFSGRTGSRIFEIMSDSNVGAFGVICLIIVILSQFVLFSYLSVFACFLMPIVGRTSVIVGSWNKKYAKEIKGMGTLFIESITKKVLISNLIILILSAIILPDRIILLSSSLVSIISSVFISNWIEDKIGGMTGDTCGFVAEITQIIFMFTVLFIEGLFL